MIELKPLWFERSHSMLVIEVLSRKEQLHGRLQWREIAEISETSKQNCLFMTA